ncbi:MAG TPA: acyltransferase [Longimicrobiales bacterium]|nr:acyltransferase [Longimicrobiales bacterium]
MSHKHIPTLDGLRGLAILLVFAFHMVKFEPAYSAEWLVAYPASFGWSGVDLFFVLSGFLITGILYDTKARDDYFRRFYWRRALRIFPLYYATLVLWLWLLPPIGGPGVPTRVGADQLWLWTYLQNLPRAIGSWKTGIRGTQHMWSLAVEEQFYLLWPLAVYFLSRRALLRVAFATIAVSLAFRVAWLAATGNVMGAYVLLPARADALAVGAALALAARGPEGLRGWSTRALGMMAAGAAVLAGVFAHGRYLGWDSPGMATVGFTATAVLYGGLLVLVVTAPAGSRLGRLFGSRAMRFFGKYSYGMYVLGAVSELVGRLFGAQELYALRVGGSALPGAVLASLVYLAANGAVALLSWHLLEKWSLALKDRTPVRGVAAAS